MKGMIVLNNDVFHVYSEKTNCISDSNLYNIILYRNLFRSKERFVKAFVKQSNSEDQQYEYDYMNFLLDKYKSVSNDLNVLSGIEFVLSSSYYDTIKSYEKYLGNKAFENPLINEYMLNTLLRRKAKSSKNDKNALFYINPSDKFPQIDINSPENDCEPHTISVYKNSSYTLTKDTEKFIKAINKICFCIFKNTINNFIATHKDDKELIKLINIYEPVLLFHYLSAKYNNAFEYALLMCMYHPKKTGEAIGIKIFGQSLYNRLWDIPSCQFTSDRNNYDLQKQGRRWTFDFGTVSRNSSDSDMYTKIKSAKSKLDLYHYCCKLLNKYDPLSNERINSDIALFLYNSSIRNYCYNYKFQCHKRKKRIVSSLEYDVHNKKQRWELTIWYSIHYFKTFNYHPPIGVIADENSINDIIQEQNELLDGVLQFRKNIKKYYKLTDFKPFVDNYYEFIVEHSNDSFHIMSLFDKYDICIEALNGIAREAIFTYLMDEYIIKQKQLSPSTTDFEQTPPDSSKEPPL